MTDLPDAPWIQDAELNGYPEAPTVYCPVCGRECDTVYLMDGEPVGCDKCIEEWNAADWKAQAEEGGDDW